MVCAIGADCMPAYLACSPMPTTLLWLQAQEVISYRRSHAGPPAPLGLQPLPQLVSGQL